MAQGYAVPGKFKSCINESDTNTGAVRVVQPFNTDVKLSNVLNLFHGICPKLISDRHLLPLQSGIRF